MACLVFYLSADDSGVVPLDLDDIHIKSWVIDGTDPCQVARAMERGEPVLSRNNQAYYLNPFRNEIVCVNDNVPSRIQIDGRDNQKIIPFAVETIDQKSIELDFERSEHEVPFPPELALALEENRRLGREKTLRPFASDDPIALERSQHCYCELREPPYELQAAILSARGRPCITTDEDGASIRKFVFIYNSQLIKLRPDGGLFLTQDELFIVADWSGTSHEDRTASHACQWRVIKAEEAAIWFGHEPVLAPPVLRPLVDALELTRTKAIGLPSAVQAQPAPTDRGPVLQVVLRGGTDPPIVRGKEKPRLTQGQYKVVSALVAAHPRRLNKSQLEHQSKVSDPVKMMRRLMDKDLDWKAVLIMAGEPHGGYGIHLHAPRDAEKNP
jgi:hypothetical protein